MQNNESITLRVDMINGRFTLSPESTAFMDLVRTECDALARKLQKAAPATCDVGRYIAATDHLQQTKNLYCDAVILGNEADTRKKRKSTENK